MSEELSNLVQILQLQGKGLSFLFKGIRMSAKGVKKGVDLAKVKHMQTLMKIHYANLGTTDGTAYENIVKITGGNYGIYNIPTEDEGKIKEFFDSLKKVKVPFAKMDDINIGDDMIQIAYDPQAKDRLMAVINAYQKKWNKEFKEITAEDYYNMNPERIEKLSKENFMIEKHADIVKDITEKNKTAGYTPITINYDTLLLEEKEKSFVFRTPLKSNKSYVFEVNKEDMIFLDDTKTTVYTHIKDSDKINAKVYDIFKGKTESETVITGKELGGFFDDVDKKTKKASENISIVKKEHFANFPKGESVSDSPKKIEESKIINFKQYEETKEIVEDVLKKENIKTLENSGDCKYYELTNYRDRLVAENSSTYSFSFQENTDVSQNSMVVVDIPKKNTFLDKEGKSLSIRIGKDQPLKMKEITKDGKIGNSKEITSKRLTKMFEEIKKIKSNTADKSMQKAYDEVTKTASKIMKK